MFGRPGHQGPAGRGPSVDSSWEERYGDSAFVDIQQGPESMV
ncbi:hypothetical protein RHOER0001_1064 [Rhodococcus erythropolis SK121]|nr:hypothetical protein RHOER0001_1064 [Rhodococcus erythropolis SK121]